jgi:hypothetical protein
MFIDLTGKKFDRLTVTKFSFLKNKKSYWLCLCCCGKEISVRADNLTRGIAKSCGCLHKEISSKGAKKQFTIHGLSKTRTYKIWKGMKNRCYNKKNTNYKNYGGRGISVCDKWLEPRGSGFLNFLKDMGEIPSGKSLDRIDNNKLKNGYSPENCKLSTMKEQTRNKRNNRMETLNDKTQCRADFAKKYNINKGTLDSRLDDLGWSIEKALTTPVRKIRPLFIRNYELQLRNALGRLKPKDNSKISFSKYLPYNSQQLYYHLETIKKDQDNCCPMCHVSYDIKPFDIDHIVPTSSAKTKEELLKLFSLNNLSLLCYICNRWIKRSNV